MGMLSWNEVKNNWSVYWRTNYELFMIKGNLNYDQWRQWQIKTASQLHANRIKETWAGAYDIRGQKSI